MHPEKLAVLQPSRLSASRSLINKMVREKWTVELLRIDIDERSRGEALYRVHTPSMAIDFIAFSNEPAKEGRTARIIGRNWDMMGALIEGPVSRGAIDQTRTELPKLYEGRAPKGSLVWVRSNRSMRLFDNLVDALARGEQPDIADLARTGYIMRNTGLDANGTFGTRSFLSYERSHPLHVPYHPQMLAAYLMREFSLDLAQHLAGQKNPKAAQLTPELRRFLGLGNGSGLGLILWANNHPRLTDRWLALREEAIVEAKAVAATADAMTALLPLLDRMIRFRREDRMTYNSYAASSVVADELERFRDSVRTLASGGGVEGLGGSPSVGDVIALHSGQIDDETQETLHSMAMELIPEKIDELLERQVVTEMLVRRPTETVSDLKELIDAQYAWTRAIDTSAPGADDFVWYKSRTAEEPRRGLRTEAPHALDLALPLAREVQVLEQQLAGADPELPLALFMASHPRQRGVIERIQGLSDTNWHTIRMNMSGHDFRPVHIIRLYNTAMYGLDKTMDYLDRSLRGLLFHGAPTRTDLGSGAGPLWFNPAEPLQAEQGR